MGGTSSKKRDLFVFSAQVLVAQVKGKHQFKDGDTKATKTLKMQVKIDDEATRICAALSTWVYNAGRELVEMKDKYNNLATAYRSVKDWREIDGYIPDGHVLPVVETGEFGGDKFVQVRFLGMAVYVKEKHTLPLEMHKVFEDEQTLAAVKAILKPVTTDEVTLARFRNGGPLLPSGVTVVVQSQREGKVSHTIYVAWQGTQADMRPMDIFTDLSASPMVAPIWFKHFPSLRAHGGMYGFLQNEYYLNGDNLKELLRRHKPEACECRLIFTGHSLGGGVALLAHMATIAEVENMRDAGTLGSLEHVQVQSKAFAAPMVFYLNGTERNDSKDHQQKLKRAREEYMMNSTNYVFAKDVVPRLPGHPDFAVPAARLAAESLLRHVAAKKLGIDPKNDTLNKLVPELVTGVSSVFLEQQTLHGTADELKNFRHLSTIRHYTLDIEGQEVMIEDGANLGRQFEREEGDDHTYLLACHSWFPHNIDLSAEESEEEPASVQAQAEAEERQADRQALPADETY